MAVPSRYYMPLVAFFSRLRLWQLYITRRSFEFCSCTCKDFPVSSRKPHCRLAVVNDYQMAILLLPLLNILCMDSEMIWHSSSPPKACDQISVMHYVFTKSFQYSQLASQSKTGIAISVVPKPNRPYWPQEARRD